MRDPQGRIIGTFGISRDITAQKHAEETFRHVIDAAPNPILVVNRLGLIRLVNAATEKLRPSKRAPTSIMCVISGIRSSPRSANVFASLGN